jgi:hypothetical protein
MPMPHDKALSEPAEGLEEAKKLLSMAVELDLM